VTKAKKRGAITETDHAGIRNKITASHAPTDEYTYDTPPLNVSVDGYFERWTEKGGSAVWKN